MPKPDNRSKIYAQFRTELKKFIPPYVARTDLDTRYELFAEKEIEIAGRKRQDLAFASLVIQSSYVGFYFMPVYTNAAVKKVFGKELLATLKGKSCFHITTLDATLLAQIRRALVEGHKIYRKNGWV